MAQGSFLAHKMTGAVVDPLFYPLLLRVRAEIMTFLLATLS